MGNPAAGKSTYSILKADGSRDYGYSYDSPYGYRAISTIPSGAGQYAYVTEFGNTGNLWRFDTDGNGLGKQVTGTPVGVAVTPDSARVYVAMGNAGTIKVVNGDMSGFPATFSAGTNLVAVAVNPVLARNRLYVVDNVGSLKVYDIGTNPTNPTLVSTTTVGTNPVSVTVSADGNRVYVANRDDDTISVIDSSGDANLVVGTLNTGDEPVSVAVNSDRTAVYVANYGSNNVWMIPI